MKSIGCILLLVLVFPWASHSQLVVDAKPLKLTASKAVVPLTLSNSFEAKIDSARASVLLMDESGKLVGQGARWVIGGQDKPDPKAGLKPGGTNIFYFVINAEKPITSTNLTPKIIFSRVMLEGGKPANPFKDVIITLPESPQKKSAPPAEKK